MNELIPADLELATNKYAADESLYSEIISSAAYLPRVQLVGGNSAVAMSGQVRPGHWGLIRSKDQVQDLGGTIELLPIAWRFKAMRIRPDAVESFHNPHSEAFKQVQAESEVQDSGCMYGLEFLIWLPQPGTFAGYYMNSKTSRRKAPDLRSLQVERRAATLKSELIKKGRNTWYGPIVLPCSTPFPLPELEELKDQAARFANPKDTEVEQVDPAAPGAQRDR